jgi:hypothetical protein
MQNGEEIELGVGRLCPDLLRIVGLWRFQDRIASRFVDTLRLRFDLLVMVFLPQFLERRPRQISGLFNCSAVATVDPVNGHKKQGPDA